MVDALASLALVAGIQPFVEPRDLPAGDDGKRRRQSSRPDIIMHGFQDVKLVDVSIMHPLAPRYVSRWRDDRFEAEQHIIIDREKRKMRQHAKLAEKTPDSSIAPFALDALGAFGSKADDLLQWLGQVAGNAALNTSSLPRMRSLLSERALRA